jgi:hypothetical protein
MRLALLCLALALPGCSGDSKAPSHRTRAQRVQDAEVAVSKTPTPRTYRIDGNELVVLEFPVHDRFGRLDLQRCYVWRDAELRHASMSCGPTDDIGRPAPEHPRD